MDPDIIKIQEWLDRTGYSQSQLAKDASMDVTFLNKSLRGKRELKRQELRAIEERMAEYDADHPPQPGHNPASISSHNQGDNSAPPGSVDLTRIRRDDKGSGESPVFGAVMGGFDGAEIDYHHPVEWRKMPGILDGVPDGCGCYVINTSMEPRFYQGEVVWVHPRTPVKRGDFVVVELQGHRAIVKRLIRVTDNFVEVEQLNPPDTKRIDRQEIVGIHLIVGSSIR